MNKTEKILNTLLQELSINRSNIAKDIGVSQQAISNWCNRDNLPKKARIHFHDTYNVNYVYLNTGEGPIFKKNEAPPDDSKSRYIEHLENENIFLRDLVKTLTKFNELLDK